MAVQKCLHSWAFVCEMQPTDLLDQVRGFRSDRLKRVSTKVTAGDGQQYVETLQDSGKYTILKSGNSTGYVVDNKEDITVSLVVQGLILGSQDVAMELKILEDFNVTHILNVGYKIPNYFESKFIYKNVEVLDDPSTDIRKFFDGCFEFIDDGRQEGCTLVHCNAGVSRAPTIVIAYLMKKYHMKLKEAYALVKSVRSNIRPNDGFMKVLEEYDKELFDGFGKTG
ncbi:dual specificity protein phosphatase 19-like isoform X2 [Stegodyphus dumicola]|uniref:dual specificity protein phosphatase 19-like isoform X2 n=1 Tax=Stegodyphus dumicola TaxID=202533 RepID=UPI0015AFA455|nr:dual specificity protein phosphatase 19-like isoform X2 [Stegodyphus dumicola]